MINLKDFIRTWEDAVSKNIKELVIKFSSKSKRYLFCMNEHSSIFAKAGQAFAVTGKGCN